MSAPCQCESCAPAAPGPTYTRRFQIECLASELLERFNREERRAFLVQVLRKRGKEIALEILTEMMRQGGQDVLSPKPRRYEA